MGQVLYSFPGPAETAYHKLGGLQHQEFIVSQSQQPEVQSYRVVGLAPPSGSGGKAIPCLSPGSRGWQPPLGLLGLRVHRTNLGLSLHMVLPPSLS